MKKWRLISLVSIFNTLSASSTRHRRNQRWTPYHLSLPPNQEDDYDFVDLPVNNSHLVDYGSFDGYFGMFEVSFLDSFIHYLSVYHNLIFRGFAEVKPIVHNARMILPLQGDALIAATKIALFVNYGIQKGFDMGRVMMNFCLMFNHSINGAIRAHLRSSRDKLVRFVVILHSSIQYSMLSFRDNFYLLNDDESLQRQLLALLAPSTAHLVIAECYRLFEGDGASHEVSIKRFDPTYTDSAANSYSIFIKYAIKHTSLTAKELVKMLATVSMKSCLVNITMTVLPKLITETDLFFARLELANALLAYGQIDLPSMLFIVVSADMEKYYFKEAINMNLDLVLRFLIKRHFGLQMSERVTGKMMATDLPFLQFLLDCGLSSLVCWALTNDYQIENVHDEQVDQMIYQHIVKIEKESLSIKSVVLCTSKSNIGELIRYLTRVVSPNRTVLEYENVTFTKWSKRAAMLVYTCVNLNLPSMITADYMATMTLIHLSYEFANGTLFHLAFTNNNCYLLASLMMVGQACYDTLSCIIRSVLVIANVKNDLKVLVNGLDFARRHGILSAEDIESLAKIPMDQPDHLKFFKDILSQL